MLLDTNFQYLNDLYEDGDNVGKLTFIGNNIANNPSIQYEAINAETLRTEALKVLLNSL